METLMLPVPSSDQEEKALSDIEKFGLHIINVMGETDFPNFSYSVGLWHAYKHPEVLLFGLDIEISMWILNEIARRVRDDDEKFCVEDSFHGLLEGFACQFVHVPKSRYADHVGWDEWLYKGQDFPLIQCVWPSTEGIFPWDNQASDWFRNWQPVLALDETENLR